MEDNKKNNQIEEPAKPLNKTARINEIIQNITLNKLDKSTPKAKGKEIEKGLKTIYQTDKSQVANLTKLEHKSSNRLLIYSLGVIFCLGILFAVSLLGLFLFQPKPKFTAEKLNLEIKAPFTAISGENVTYEIKYTNLEETNLTKARLEVYLPVGFLLEKTNKPELLVTNPDLLKESTIKTFQLGDIFTNQSDTIEISGKLIGTPQTKTTISVTLSYLPANFSSEFQKSLSFNTEIIDSLVKLEAQYPGQIANNDQVEIDLNIANSSQSLDLKNLEVELNYPPEFTLLESQLIDDKLSEQAESIKEELKPDQVPPTLKTWALPELLFQNQKHLKIKGFFKVQETKQQGFNVKVRLKGSTEEFLNQQEQNFTINVIKGELLTNLIIQGSNQNKAVNFGDTLNFLLSLQNKSKNTLGELKVRLVSDSPLLDWSTLNDKSNGVKEENQILWTKDQIPQLALLLPEEEVEITFSIKIKNYQVNNTYDDNDLQVRSLFETQINQIDNKETSVVAESNKIINEINTNVQLKASARYFDESGQTIGSGPLPPLVGQKTSYKIFWQINNSLHEIQNIEVKAKLPGYVTFEGQGKTSTGSLTVSGQEISWQISRIPTSINQATAELELTIVPTTNDINKILTLLPEITLTAKDVTTQAQIDLSAPGLTTNLEDDEQAQGKGLVKEQ